MTKMGSIRKAGVAILGAAILAIGACESTDTANHDELYRSDGVSEAGSALHAPAIRAQQERRAAAMAEPMEEPAPAPKPAAKPVVYTGGCGYTPNVGVDEVVTGLAFPTGDRATSALVLHQVMPATVRRGAEFDYEYHVTNITSGTLQNVAVTLEGRDNLEIVSSDPRANMGSDGESVWFLGEMGACETRVITVTATAQSIGTASNCISVSYNNSLCAFTNVVEPGLTITKKATPRVLKCDPITITYEVCNPGTGMTENVVIRDTLPEGLTVNGSRRIEIPVGDLAAGDCRTEVVTALAAGPGEFCSPAMAVAEGNLTAESGEPCTIVTEPRLAIACESRDTQFLNRPTTFTYTVVNEGSGVAANAMVTLSLPTGIEYVDSTAGGVASAGAVTFDLGNLAPDEARQVAVSLRATTEGRVGVSATASADCAQPVMASCDVLYQGIPAILLEAVDNPDPVEVGTQTTYRITVTNQGSAQDTNIRVVVTLPDEEEYVSANGPTTASANGQTITFAPYGTLQPKQSIVYTVTIRAIGSGDVRFGVELTSDQFTRPIRETESTNLYE